MPSKMNFEKEKVHKSYIWSLFSHFRISVNYEIEKKFDCSNYNSEMGLEFTAAETE